MTVGILIIAHGDIGPALIGAASHVLGRNLAEERVASLRAGHDEAREDFLAQAQEDADRRFKAYQELAQDRHSGEGRNPEK